MEFFNLEAYGHTLQIGYQIYLTRLATLYSLRKWSYKDGRKVKRSVSYLPVTRCTKSDGRKKPPWSPWKIGTWSFPMELSVSFTSSWVKLIERNWFKSRMFMDFVTEQLLKEFRAKFDKTELCWFFCWASVTRCCRRVVAKKSKQITDDYWRTRAASKHFLKAEFMTLFHFLPSKLEVFQFLWAIKS